MRQTLDPKVEDQGHVAYQDCDEIPFQRVVAEGVPAVASHRLVDEREIHSADKHEEHYHDLYV